MIWLSWVCCEVGTLPGSRHQLTSRAWSALQPSPRSRASLMPHTTHCPRCKKMEAWVALLVQVHAWLAAKRSLARLHCSLFHWICQGMAAVRSGFDHSRGYQEVRAEGGRLRCGLHGFLAIKYVCGRCPPRSRCRRCTPMLRRSLM